MQLTLALLTVFLLPVSNLHALTCSPGETPKAYTAIREAVDLEIKTFANKKSVAEKADATLSKLIAAKSPLIVTWMSKRQLNADNEEQVVREWRDYFARNFVLTMYPHGDRAIDSEIEKLMTAINKKFASQELQNRMKSRFEKSQKAAISWIKNLKVIESLKQKMVRRVEAIRLYWMKDFKNSKFKQLPLDFLDWGIAYDPNANEINIGINSLSYPNEETYFAVFLHEIGHSFDSCRWGAFFEAEWPFAKVGECLRSAGSVSAKKRDDSKLETLLQENKLSSDVAKFLQANPTCNKLTYPPVGLQADQLPEAFADWFSAEVLSTLNDMNPLHIRADLCGDKELSPGSSYVSNDLRLNGIYFTHPKFKKASSREPTYLYCELSTTFQKLEINRDYVQ